MSKRILVVDDEVVVLGAVSKALRKTDCAIDSVESAERALELLKKASYDLVIADLMMPEVDGLELMLRLREMGSPVRVIMITGYPTIRTALRAKQLGAFEYVTKPFTRQELVSVVARALRQGDRITSEAAVSDLRCSENNVYFIPEHAWARLGADKTAQIGLALAFASSVGEITEIKLPVQDQMLEQGKMCVVLRAKDGEEHFLHSPLSGRVIERNHRILQDPGLAARDPEGDGWLLRITPDDPDRELPNLASR